MMAFTAQTLILILAPLEVRHLRGANADYLDSIFEYF